LFLIVWVLVAVGASRAWKASRLLVAFAISCVVLGVILAATPLIETVSHYIPFAGGYREPDKFANLIVLGYAMLGTLGVAFTAQWAVDKFRDTGGQVVTIICLLLPLAITPAMLWGFGGQLSPKQYPDGWYEMNEKLREAPGQKRVLFLPWHQYMAFGFSGRIIATPAEKFFTVPVIASDDPEFGGITPTEPNAEKAAVKQALDNPDTLAATLKARNINYILLAKEDDANSYSYLNKDKRLVKTAENGTLILYKVAP